LFFQTLQDFQTDFHDSVAVGLDIKDQFENASGIDLTNYFEEWYFGEGFPTYSTRWNSLSGNLILEITHTTSVPAVTPTFTNPLEIRFSRSGQADTVIRFNVNSNLNQYVIPAVGTVTGVSAIDPNNWIINRFSSNTYDPTFIQYINVPETASDEKFMIFPNPANEYATIQMHEDVNYTLSVFSAKGKLIATQNFKGSTTLNTENIATGSYIIEVQSDELGTVNRKILIKQ
jgi:hypothetical protein